LGSPTFLNNYSSGICQLPEPPGSLGRKQTNCYSWSGRNGGDVLATKSYRLQRRYRVLVASGVAISSNEPKPFELLPEALIPALHFLTLGPNGWRHFASSAKKRVNERERRLGHSTKVVMPAALVGEWLRWGLHVDRLIDFSVAMYVTGYDTSFSV
jgi:hypothetical protein